MMPASPGLLAINWKMYFNFSFLVLSFSRQAEVGTVEAAHERLAREMKLMDDVFSGDFVGSGSERHHRHAIELLVEESELGIFRTEIMSPLTDAVSLVDGEKGNLDVAE